MKKLLVVALLFAAFTAGAQVQVVTLSGSGSDNDGFVTGFKWRQIGTTPSACKIANDTLAMTTVVPAGGVQWTPGVYSFQFTVTDNLGDTKSDTVRVTVTSSNPVVDAGNAQSIQLPAARVTLRATATVTLGIVKTWAWTQISGPTTAIFTRTDTSTVGVSNLSAGFYLFRMTIRDNYGAIATDSVQIVVKSVNSVPRADAGPDQSVTLPLQAVSLGGFDTPPNGAAIQWVKLRGPSGGTIVSPTASFTKVIELPIGSYIFQKSVTMDGMTARDIVNVTVKKRCSWWQSLFGCKG